MFERLQKKYRPQLPRPLSYSNMPTPSFIDATEPAAVAANAGESSKFAKHQQSSLLSSKHVSRAQNLIKKSKRVVAELKEKVI